MPDDRYVKDAEELLSGAVRSEHAPTGLAATATLLRLAAARSPGVAAPEERRIVPHMTSIIGESVVAEVTADREASRSRLTPLGDRWMSVLGLGPALQLGHAAHDRTGGTGITPLDD